MATYTGTIPSGTLAVGAGLPAAWTQQVGLSLTAVESAWTAYTPAVTGFTQGNGTVSGAYMQVGKLVHFWARFIFGSTSAAAASRITVSLPVAAETAVSNSGNICAVGSFMKNAGSQYQAAVSFNGSTGANLWIQGASGIMTALSTTTPFTWATLDSCAVAGTYVAQ